MCNLLSTKIISAQPFPREFILQRMKEVLYTGYNDIDNIFTYLIDSDGKMLRPRLLYLIASSYPKQSITLKDIAVAVELIHMASLIHDDIIDNADSRRGKKSLNALYGNHIGVLSGDYLFATAFHLINLHQCTKVMENVTHTIRLMCSGEILQNLLAYKIDISLDEYYEKSYLKTACLFASSCKIGALLSEASEQEVKLFEEYGLYLGYAYQIIDDVLDYLGDSETTGKTTGNDLLEGNITLPVILALKDKNHAPALKKIITQNEITRDELPLIMDILINSKAFDKSISIAKEYLQKAISNLRKMPFNPALNELENIAQLLIKDYEYKSHADYLHLVSNEA